MSRRPFPVILKCVAVWVAIVLALSVREYSSPDGNQDFVAAIAKTGRVTIAMALGAGLVFGPLWLLSPANKLRREYRALGLALALAGWLSIMWDTLLPFFGIVGMFVTFFCLGSWAKDGSLPTMQRPISKPSSQVQL